MKAMILAAGLGTRLLPLTENKPKALIEINGKTLLEICITKLIDSGIRNVVINVHHHAGMIIDYLQMHENFGINITISDERTELLDSGGGILKAAPFLGNGNFLVYNVDIISSINLAAIQRKHQESGALATLAVRNRKTSRYLLFDKEGNLRGWKNEKENLVNINEGYQEEALVKLAFSGIHVINHRIFSLLEQTGKFSIIETYLNLSRKENIRAFQHDNDNWLDVGKPESLKDATILFSK